MKINVGYQKSTFLSSDIRRHLKLILRPYDRVSACVLTFRSLNASFYVKLIIIIIIIIMLQDFKVPKVSLP
jgi:uncharacterized membrane protein